MNGKVSAPMYVGYFADWMELAEGRYEPVVLCWRYVASLLSQWVRLSASDRVCVLLGLLHYVISRAQTTG
jgi:hypothetical protein